MPSLGGKQKLFEARKILDNSHTKMIEVRHHGQLFFLAVGTARDSKGMNVEKRFEWVFLFTPANIPGFMQIDQFKKLTALVASVSMGSRIEEEHTTYIPTVSFGGADIRWEITQLVGNYLDSIGCTGYGFDEGPEVEYSTSAKLAQIRFSLRNASFTNMRIVGLTLDVVYTQLESREVESCAVITDQIQVEEGYRPTTDELNQEIEKLETKLKADLAAIFKEFVQKKIAKRS
jgi:hypothetical protein